MKRIYLSAALVALSTASAFAQAVPSSLYASDVPNDFHFSLEAMAIGKSQTNTPIAFDSVDSAFVGTRDILKSSHAGGLRFTFGKEIDGVWGIELHGMGSTGFGSTGLYIDDNELLDAAYDTGGTAGNLFFSSSNSAYAVRVTESGSLGSLGANATYRLDENFNLTFGPRVLRYQSGLRTMFYDEDDDLAGTDDGIDIVDINSTNTLVGTQIGVAGMLPLNDMVKLGGSAAVGLYANYATLNRSYSDNGYGSSPFNTGSVSSNTTAVGFAQTVEISPKVDVALNDNLALTLGGTLLWVNGLDEPGTHYAGMGVDDGTGNLAADTPRFGSSALFAGVTAGLKGTF